MTVYRLHEMGPDEVERRLAMLPALILPIGTIEWHSYHLPLGLDGIKAESLATRVAEESGAFLAPVSWWAAGGVAFPYTLRLPTALIEAILREVFIQFATMGFRAIVALNGHYGLDNSLAVRRAAAACMRETSSTVLPVAEYEVLLRLGATGDHAGVWETSLLWAVRPDLVRLDDPDLPEDLPGVVGEDPRRRASRDLGEQGIEEVVGSVTKMISRALTQDSAARRQLIDALDASIRPLEAILELRRNLPRSEVPPVATPAWLEHLRHFHGGQYNEATRHANRKRADPAV